MNNASKDSLALVKQKLRSTGSYTGALLLSLPIWILWCQLLLQWTISNRRRVFL